jgi:hypothetical protein
MTDPSTHRWLLTFTSFLTLLFAAQLAHAAPSRWATEVGMMAGSSDKFLWCTTKVSPQNPRLVESHFKLIPSDPNDLTIDLRKDARAAQRLRAVCYPTAPGATATNVYSGYSVDAVRDCAGTSSADCVTVECPAGTQAVFAQCQIDAHTDAAPQVSRAAQYVYNSSDCGSGVASIGKAQVHGQVTGEHAEYIAPEGFPAVNPPLWNNTFSAGRVWGTDEGSIFLAQGKLNYVFGDTYDIETTLDADAEELLNGFLGWLSSVLATSQDFNLADGLTLSAWEKEATAPAVAKQLFRSDRNIFSCLGGFEGECSAIPTAGFGLTDKDGNRWRFLWFTSIRSWDRTLMTQSFKANLMTLAYSVNDKPWTRLDDSWGTPNVASEHDTPSGRFGPGAVWFDRFKRELYFFGIDTSNSLFGAVKLAKVRSAPADILDPSKYRFWNGSSWMSDPTQATAIIPFDAQTQARAEISVAYNAHSGRWLMMLLNGSPRFGLASAQIELWQSPPAEPLQPPQIVLPTSTGSPDPKRVWSKVAGRGQLPGWWEGSNRPFAGAPYGPMINDHLMVDGGKKVYFMVSEWHPVYNTHLWSFDLNANTSTLQGYCPAP